MPTCKNNPKKNYTGKEPSPKGLGYCASGEKEGTEMKGNDGDTWVVKRGRWVKQEFDDFLLFEKLYRWWRQLAMGNFIIIKKDGTSQLIKSRAKTFEAQVTDLEIKWLEYTNDPNVEAILWSAQSSDIIEEFTQYIVKHETKEKLKYMMTLKNLPAYLLENYKKYFIKHKIHGKKDYTLRP